MIRKKIFKKSTSQEKKIENDLNDRSSPIAILGYGVEGKTMYAFLRKHRYKNITICDKDERLVLGNKVQRGINVRLGKHYLKDLIDFKRIFRSPGIPYLTKEIQEAQKKGVIISSQTKYVFDHCEATIIGITGTKGKGTTASLLYHMLKRARKKVFLGGNIGEPPIKLLPKVKRNSFLILELSSFQLQDLHKSPHIAIVLNVTSEHLDHHQDTEEYQEAKESIAAYQSDQDYAIINQDYRGSAYYADRTPAHILTVSAKKAVDHGAYVRGDIIYLNMKDTITLCHIREIALIGRHNLENILPAITVASLLGCPRKAIFKTLKTFKGLPHRLESVTKRKGITFYNDSASTVPEATSAAIRTFETPLILIAGGSEKYADFSDLARAIILRRNLKTVMLIGQTARRLQQALQDANQDITEEIEHLDKTGQKADMVRDLPLKIIRAKNLHEAFLSLKLEAIAGDTVLLSPACASFGEFQNYKHRGEVFKKFAKRF